MPNKKLEPAIRKILESFPITEGKWNPDCVSVNLQASGYIQEIVTGEFNGRNTKNSTGYILSYKDGKLITQDGKLADTSISSSKGYSRAKAFVMSKDAEITLFDHGNFATHGSAAKAKPLEAAGVISIINGKITYIVDDSGHYLPDKYDIYRMIKSLDQKMPGVIDEQCIIDPIPDKIENALKLSKSDFLAHMEQNIDGIPLWQKMRNDRILEHEKMHLMHSFNSNPKPHTLDMIAKKVIIDISNSSFTSAIASLSPEDKKHLTNPEYSIVLKSQGTHKIIPISELVKETIKENDLGSKAILFESGLLDISRESEFKRNLPSMRINKLIDEGVDLSATFDSDGNNALANYILSHGDNESDKRDKIFLLANAMPNPNSPNKKGKTAAHIAVSKSSFTFEQVINSGLNFNVKDNYGKTPLDYIIQNNDIEKLDILLKSGIDIDIHLPGEYGNTPLSNSIYKPQIFSILLNAGADVNHISSYTGSSLLHLITRQLKDTNLLEEVLKHNPDLNTQEKGNHNLGCTPLHIASLEGKVGMVRLLLEAGADPNIKTRSGETALDLAISKENTEIIASLLSKENLDLGNKTLGGNTPLHNSMDVKHLDYEITYKMLEKGADPNAQNNLGETPLHRAVQTGNHKLVEAFIKKGANIGIKNKEGKSPLDYAMQISDQQLRQEIVRSLALSPESKKFISQHTPGVSIPSHKPDQSRNR